MTRIVLLDPEPPTANEILIYIVRYCFIVLASVIVLDTITRFLGDASTLNNLLNLYLWPWLRYFLWVGGITISPLQNGQMTAMGCLLFVLSLRAVAWIPYYIRALRQEIEERPAELGTAAAPLHDRWLVTAVILFMIAGMLRLYPLPISYSLEANIFQLLRLTVVLLTLSFGSIYAWLGIKFYQRWRALNPKGLEPEQKKKPALKVIHNEAPKPSGGNRPLLVALAAELIQFCGQHNRAPSAAELAGQLSPLLRAAQLTGSAPLSPSGLESLCSKALDLFTHKRLKSLKDVKAASALFNKPRSGAIDEIVNELDQRLNN